MKKQKYAPTRSMRKQQNSPTKKEKSTEAEPVEEVVQEEAIEKVARRRLSTKEKIFLTLSLVAILSLTLATILIWTRERPLDTDNPVAVFELSNGMTLEFELNVRFAPTAVSNFIHLANLKVYDQTSIHKIENNQLFGGYYREYFASTSTSDNTLILTQFKNKDIADIVSYKVRKRDDSPRKAYDRAYLSTVQTSDLSDYSTEFRITLDSVDNIAGVYGTVFGTAYGETTNNNLEELKKTPVYESLSYSPRVSLMIKSVKIKANDKKWKSYNFFSDHVSEDYIKVGIA